MTIDVTDMNIITLYIIRVHTKNNKLWDTEAASLMKYGACMGAYPGHDYVTV